MTSEGSDAREVKAWACLAANALVLPGLGSFLAGQRLVGALQALLSLAGFALTMLWAGSWIARLTTTGLPEGLGPYFRHGAAGLGLFALAWVWGLVSGLLLVHASRTLPSS